MHLLAHTEAGEAEDQLAECSAALAVTTEALEKAHAAQAKAKVLAESAAASKTKRKKKVSVVRGGAAALLQAQQERSEANQEATNAELARDARKAAEKAAASQAAKDKAGAEHTAKLAKAPMKHASEYIAYAAKCLGPGLKHFFDSFGKDDSGEGSHFED